VVEAGHLLDQQEAHADLEAVAGTPGVKNWIPSS
jgi:hypothetical protein